MSAHLGEDYIPLKKMIDLNKAGAWSDVEQLEIAELLRNPTEAMKMAAIMFELDYEQRHGKGHSPAPEYIFKAMIDAATGGESDG